MSRAVYPTDLTEAEWQILEPLVPPVKPGGRPAKYSRREVVNAIRYVLRTGCAWRLLPHDLPPWQSVYHHFEFGGGMGPGRGFTTPCSPRCGGSWVASPAPAGPSSTASR